MPFPANKKIGRYEICSQLGAGGMGEVYLANDTKLDRKVALKILPASVVDTDASDDRVRRFVQEAKAVSALNHPNILTIYEVDEIDSEHFIATEYVDGETLRDRIRFTPLSLSDALDVAIQVASALSATHDVGIIHRDIKPDNIMLRRDGIVKVLDFGLAKLTRERPQTSQTDSMAPTQNFVNTAVGVVMGTAHYMSPEQARGLDVDARTDIWSLGCVLYEMVAGHQPFRRSTALDVMSGILDERAGVAGPIPAGGTARSRSHYVARVAQGSRRTLPDHQGPPGRSQRSQTSDRDLLVPVFRDPLQQRILQPTPCRKTRSLFSTSKT